MTFFLFLNAQIIPRAVQRLRIQHKPPRAGPASVLQHLSPALFPLRGMQARATGWQ